MFEAPACRGGVDERMHGRIYPFPIVDGDHYACLEVASVSNLNCTSPIAKDRFTAQPKKMQKSRAGAQTSIERKSNYD